MIEPPTVPTSGTESLDIHLDRFFPNGASPRWSVPFSAPPHTMFPGPVPLALPGGEVLVIWSLTQATEAIEGWPVAIPPGSTNTLFGVWSASGQFRGGWTLAGFTGTGLVPKEDVGFLLGREGVSVTAGGAVYLAAVSTGGSLGPDFGSQSTTPQAGVLVRYSAAHTCGCASLHE